MKKRIDFLSLLILEARKEFQWEGLSGERTDFQFDQIRIDCLIYKDLLKMRKLFFGGNWKCNNTLAQTQDMVTSVLDKLEYDAEKVGTHSDK